MKKEDKATIAAMYAILQTQNAIIWDKISGHNESANADVIRLTPKIKEMENLLIEWIECSDTTESILPFD